MVKIVKGRTLAEIARPRVEMVRQTHIHPLDAKEVAMACDLCGKIAYGPRSVMQAAMEEHRRIGCSGGETNEKRIYRITYPRA